MANAYTTHTSQERREMLRAIGVEKIEDLFSAIPEEVRVKAPLRIPEAYNEWQLRRHMEQLASSNATIYSHDCFLGGGTYEHYIPSVIDAIVSRGEFLTSYTPYQPEMSQGLLQALYEYQELMSIVTGLPVSNSSCYDGATALADGIWMGCVIQQAHETKKVLSAGNVFPMYQEVVASYMQARPAELHQMVLDDTTGLINLDMLEDRLKTLRPSVFVFQTPNVFGGMEDMRSIAELCRKYEVIPVVSYHPFLSALYETPGELGIDIVTGNGQVLGIPMRAGGSSLGIFATSKAYRKYLPGRLVGKVTDIKGNPAYALVFEDREQHIAREKATSNICSNQALNAVRAAIYLSTTGKQGFYDIAVKNVENAHRLQQGLCEIEGVSLARQGAFFNEFTLALSKPVPEVLKAAAEQKIFAGIDRSALSSKGEHLLTVAVTETKTAVQLEKYITVMREVLR